MTPISIAANIVRNDIAPIAPDVKIGIGSKAFAI
jgi:hypothetical protein